MENVKFMKWFLCLTTNYTKKSRVHGAVKTLGNTNVIAGF